MAVHEPRTVSGEPAEGVFDGAESDARVFGGGDCESDLPAVWRFGGAAGGDGAQADKGDCLQMGLGLYASGKAIGADSKSSSGSFSCADNSKTAA